MAMESTLQVRMDSALKTEVEALYKSLGTSFAEAVRIFAQQSIREGGMPFTPSLKSWDELSQAEIDARLHKSMADVAAGRVISQEQLDAMKAAESHAKALFQYYGSEDWHADRDMELPDGFKAGVLSEDSVYDAITELRDAAFDMLELGTDILKTWI